MVTGNLVGDGLVDASAQAITEIGRIGNWMQALGIVVILWILFQLVNLWLNRRRWKKLEEFDIKVNRIERKLDKLIKRR